MRAYWYDNEPGDQRLPHDSGRAVDASELARLGVVYSACPSVADVNALASERGYNHRDQITISPAAMGEVYEAKVRAFFHEHLHEDEEIRYILGGGGFFDVRSPDDAWIRIRCEKDDLLVLPAGIYHRFTTDEENFTEAMRLFKDDPKWTPINRDAESDTHPIRQDYVKQRDGANMEVHY